MLQLLGEFDCSMDAKGRFRLPAALVKQLGERSSYHFVLNKGFEKHLTLYPIEIWEKSIAGFAHLNTYDADTRLFLRRFHNGATQIELDEQGRLLVPKRLCEYAGLEKEIILSAYNEKIEIWDAATFDASMNDTAINMSDLAQKVLGNRIE